MHEAAHVAKHLGGGNTDAYFDDLKTGAKDAKEREADRLAVDTLIPPNEWRAAKLGPRSSPADIVAFAERLRINPAIPAGRIQYESKNYKVFRGQTGSGKVRCMFGVET